MRGLFIALALVAVLALPSLAEPWNAKQMEAEIQALLRQYETMGPKGFQTAYPDGTPKEKYVVAEDGVVSYSKFFPAGNYAVKYQRKTDGVVSFERWYGNGQAAIVLTRDPRITAYTAYWPTGVTKAKFQSNRHTGDRFLILYDEQGKQIAP